MRVFFLASTDKRQRYRFVMEPLKSVGIDVSLYQEDANPFTSFMSGLKYILSTSQFDAFVMTGGDLRNVVWLILLRIFTKSRIVVRFGGDPIAVRRSAQRSFGKINLLANIRSKAGALSSTILLKYVDGVIVVSDHLADTLRPMLGHKTHLTVAPPVLLNRCKPKSNYRQQSESFNILTVTNLNYYEKAEGVTILVQAIKNACLNHPGLMVRLNVVGGGLQFNHLKTKLASIELPDNFFLSLHGQQKKVSEYYESADIFAYHSTLDSYPLVLLEAVAHGLPMILNSWGPLPKIYDEGNNALFYETGNVSGLEDLIVRLAGSENLREKLGKSALLSFQKNQSMKSRGIKLQSFFQELTL